MKMTPIQKELQKMGSRISVILLVIGVLLLGLDLWVHRHGETDLEDGITRLVGVWQLRVRVD